MPLTVTAYQAPDTGPTTQPVPATVETSWFERALNAFTDGPATTLTAALLSALIAGLGVYFFTRRPGKNDFSKQLMYIPLLLVNGAAVYGQVAFFYETVAPTAWAVPGKILLAVVIALAIESISIYVGWHAHDALINKLGHTAARLRRASYGIAGLVAAINYAHFADFSDRTGNRLGLNAASVAFGLLSLISPWLWGLHSRRLKNLQLAKEGVIDATGAVFSGERVRSFPLRSYLARRWSIDRYITDPRQAWRGYNHELRMRWAADVDQPGWWLRINPAARVKQLAETLTGQKQLSWAIALHAETLTGELTSTRAAVGAAERNAAAQTARVTALTEERDTLTGELETARADIEDLTDQLTQATSDIQSARHEMALTVEARDDRIRELEKTLTDTVDRLTGENADALRKAQAEYTSKLAIARAEARVPRLDDRRGKASPVTSPASTGRASLTDEDAVQKMLTEQSDPSFEWSKNAVRELLGVGFGRAEKLIPMWLTAARENASGKPSGGVVAVNQ
ncbi:hypothetical protein [Actinoplanes rectilineatus]|uniref:hypothetical protein n=1 Tax=Actinoplanes rectilineatus TaxID=113571 RepID=UPI0006966FC8|nr:hypothetical protein [Actinoplanes rectilineatus]